MTLDAELESGLRRLKLRRIREILEEKNRLAVERQPSYLDFLTDLIREEVTARDDTQYEKRLKAAKLPDHKTIEGFDFAFQTSISRQQVLELARLQFVQNRENIVLCGPPGTGKSHLAKALLLKAIQAGYNGLFTTVQELTEDLYASLADGTFRNRMRALQRLDVLALDELGFMTMDSTASNHLFQVVAQAYENRSLIITSNRSFQDWGTVFATPTIATAVLDRLLHHVHILNLQGDSYRLRGGLPA
ncbi:MAG: IS21-like element helper ATPase IstB [Pseudarthrobacter sp.]